MACPRDFLPLDIGPLVHNKFSNNNNNTNLRAYDATQLPDASLLLSRWGQARAYAKQDIATIDMVIEALGAWLECRSSDAQKKFGSAKYEKSKGIKRSAGFFSIA